MTSVNDLRATSNQRNAALSGALSAFASKSTSQPHSKARTTKTPGAAAAAAFSSQSSRPTAPPKKPSLQSYPSSHSYSTQLPSSKPDASNASFWTPQISLGTSSVSESNAKVGSSALSAATAAAKVRSPLATNPLPSPAANEERLPEMPNAGTVEGVKKWLAGLDSLVDDSPPGGPSRHETPPLMQAITRSRTEGPEVAQIANKSPQIQSPKPIRRLTLVNIPHHDGTAEVELEHTRVELPVTVPSGGGNGQDSVPVADVSSSKSIPARVKPDPPPARRSNQQASNQPPRLTPQQSTVSLSSVSVPQGRGSPAPRIPSRTHQQRVDPTNLRMARHMTGDSLANAIVASHVASTLAPAFSDMTPSPAKTPPPPSLPRRHTERYLQHLPFLGPSKNEAPNPRTPSPIKASNTGGLKRHTMRKKSSSSSLSDDNTHRYKKHKHFLIRTHPNKHHEGDRKRWRDVITDRERKRYEGVWAANKGIHAWPLHAAEPEQHHKLHISNLVVRDIWSRSRLPSHILEEVWSLVDRSHDGLLGREEFIVGLWLIDQRLKGRKLPTRVGESVWRSLIGVSGIKIPRLDR